MSEFWTRDYYYWEDGYKDTNVANVTTVANKAGRNSGQVNTQCSVPSEGKNYWTVARLLIGRTMGFLGNH